MILSQSGGYRAAADFGFGVPSILAVRFLAGVFGIDNLAGVAGIFLSSSPSSSSESEKLAAVRFPEVFVPIRA